MLRRLFLIFLSSLIASVSYANQASWNCEQNKDSKEWVCVGEKNQAAKTSEAAPPVKRESVKAVQPALTGPVEKMQPVKTQPVQVTEPPKPVSTEPVQPVIPAPIESRQTFMPEPVRAIPPVAAKSVESIQPAKSVPVQGNQPLVTESVKSIQPTLSASQKPAVDSSKLSGEGANRLGWNCDANKGDENWNCQLVGPEPEGKARLVATDGPTMSLLSPAFDHQQEQTFSTLTSQLPYDPWKNCNVERGTQRDFVPGASLRDASPFDVKSNYAEVFDNEISSYFGNVKMARADQHASSNTANYDSVSDVLELHGNVYYSEDALALHSDTATINLASDQAKLRDMQFISPTTPLRGRSKSFYRQSRTLSQYTDVAYTSCRPGNQDWIIHASELKMNKTTGKGVAKNTWMEFKGVPVLYSPYLSFPIDNRRLSGFLAPSFGSTKYSGFRLAAPYYWNIAPNYDATLIPRELTKRGPLLAAKFRYLSEQSKGNLGLEFMPHDSLLNKARYLGSIKNNWQITPHINSVLDLGYVSDKTYFAELGNALSFANYSYLRSFANVNYAGQGVSLTGLVDNYQAISTTITPANLPYRRMPQINLSLNHSFQFMPLTTAMENEYVYFQQASLVSAQRVNTKPSVSVPLQTASSFFTPKLSLQHTQYALNNITPNNSQAGTPGSISRTLPIFSADSGLYFERGLDIGNTQYLHTLEPRLFYLYVPYTNQNNIPVFDSAQFDFQYNTMFRENSFSGTDRIQDANQVTTALTSRLVDDKTGLERLKFSVGEIFYFRDRLVTVPTTLASPIVQANGTPTTTTIPLGAATNSFSNVVGELSSELTRQLSVTTGLQWNPVLHDFERGKAAIHYSNPSNEIFNIGYLYRKNPLIPNRSNDISQSDMSFRYPVYDNWSVMGRWQYSVLYHKTQDAFFGLEKENCCWRFRIALRHYINNISNTVVSSASQVLTGTAQNGIFFEIELKGMSSLGDNMDYFLQHELYGYRKNLKND